jgi:hypothetical protein
MRQGVHDVGLGRAVAAADSRGDQLGYCLIDLGCNPLPPQRLADHVTSPLELPAGFHFDTTHNLLCALGKRC